MGFDNGTGGLNVNPAGTLLYTTEIGPSMAVYSIATTGAITFVFDTVNIRAHSFESMPVVHPNNQFVYAAAYTEGIIGYQANQNGTMTELPGNPFKPESFLAGIEPSGQWMYGVSTAMASGAVVIPYQVNSQTGAITADLALMVGIRTANHQFTFGDTRMDAQGKFLFITDQGNNAIYTYSINQQTGAVQFVGSASTGGETPGSITTTPSDSFLYVGSMSQPHILGYSISQSGKLTSINGGKPLCFASHQCFRCDEGQS